MVYSLSTVNKKRLQLSKSPHVRILAQRSDTTYFQELLFARNGLKVRDAKQKHCTFMPHPTTSREQLSHEPYPAQIIYSSRSRHIILPSCQSSALKLYYISLNIGGFLFLWASKGMGRFLRIVTRRPFAKMGVPKLYITKEVV